MDFENKKSGSQFTPEGSSYNSDIGEFIDNCDFSKFQQQNNFTLKIDSVRSLIMCEICSLDFSTQAYLERHNNTKKHKYALMLAQRGIKFSQKRTYFRREEIPSKQRKRKLSTHEIDVLRFAEAERQKNHNKKSRTEEIIPELVIPQSIPFTTTNSTSKLSAKDIEILKIAEEEIQKIRHLRARAEEEKFAQTVQHTSTSSNPSLTSLKNPETFRTAEEEIKSIRNLKAEEDQFGGFPFHNLTFTSEKSKHICRNDSFVTPLSQSMDYCHICDRSFNYVAHYKQHMQIAHLTQRNFKCLKCGKKFETNDKLREHMLKHTLDKPHKCKKCPKSFNHRTDLVRHEKSHEAIKDYNCKICGYGFVRYDHLLNHYKLHQKKEEMELIKTLI